MPTPKVGETKSAWMRRCVPILMSGSHTQTQAYAICTAIFDPPDDVDHADDPAGPTGPG